MPKYIVQLDHRWHHRVDEAITASLSSLGLDFVDLYMMVMFAMSAKIGTF